MGSGEDTLDEDRRSSSENGGCDRILLIFDLFVAQAVRICPVELSFYIGILGVHRAGDWHGGGHVEIGGTPCAKAA